MSSKVGPRRDDGEPVESGLGVPRGRADRYRYVRDSGPVWGRIMRPVPVMERRTNRTIRAR